MNKTFFSQVINFECPFCDRVHEIYVSEAEAEAIIKNQIVKYIRKFYFCKEEDEEFVPEKVMDANLFNAREAYRKQNNLLTANEIKEIRNTYQLSQKEYANLLGVGDITIQRYETKLIQDEPYDMLMRLTKDNSFYCMQLLEKNKKNFSVNRYKEIRDIIASKIKKYAEDKIIYDSIQIQYIDYQEPTEKNGFCLLDIAKIEVILNYIAHYVEGLYKVKMMKILWYIDQLSFKRNGKAITGLVYQHMPLGALPIAHYYLMKLSTIRVEEEERDDYIAYKIYPNAELAIDKLECEEISIIQEVIFMFREYKTKKMVEYMHKENAYKNTRENDIIAFAKENVIFDFKN